MASAKKAKAATATTGGCCSTNVKNQVLCVNIPGKANLVLLGGL